MRYREPVKFLQISSITSNFSYSADLSLGGTVPTDGAKVFDTGVGAAYRETPTITYTPLEGERFVSQFMKETPVAVFILLVRGGWNIGRVMRLTMDRIAGLYNYPEAESYLRFIKLAQLWEKLQARGDLTFVKVTDVGYVVAETVPAAEVRLWAHLTADKGGYYLEPRKDGQYRLHKLTGSTVVMELRHANAAEAAEADAALGLKPKRREGPNGSVIQRLMLTDPIDVYKFESEAQDVTRLPIWIRSFFNQLYYASRSIDLPPGTEKSTRIYRNVKGEAVDQKPFFQNFLTIRSSETRPEDALVSVRYRDFWFYIEDQNRQSKDTFNLLSLIFALQSNVETVSPVLTIPVGG
ncbi:MAG: hypothetical protein OEU26_34135 [Candidatus Tectomicrobia bacterium]|nr:hypothetical protein [Candidatus Tectomicrobia bacterium]